MSQAHLTDLFKTGEIVTVELTVDGDPKTFDIWMRKPTVEQQQQARTKGSASAARIKRRYRDKDSDEYLALWDGILDLETEEEAMQSLVEADRSNLSTRAYHETLFGEHGSNWTGDEVDGVEGRDFDGIIAGEAQRWREIEANNESDPENKIMPDKDEELLALRGEHAVFDAEWDECTEIFMQEERAKYRDMSMEDLRVKLAKEAIGLESLMGFHQEYRMHMLHYACRLPDSKKTLYFHSKEDILDLPIAIQTQLLDKLDVLQKADPKVSATPQSF